MSNPVLEKIGVKRGMRSILIDPPPEVVGVFDMPGEDVSDTLTGFFDYIHVFLKRRDDLDATFPKLKEHLNSEGMLWVSWPKGRPPGTDLTLRGIIEIGYRHGLVESKVVSVDSTWSAMKFTFPEDGKQYNNSYGNLERGDP